jgi:hypothetical protein
VVADDDRSVRVQGAGNPDAERSRPAVVFAFLLYAERPAGCVSDEADGDVELCRATLRGVVAERQVAVDPVPLAREGDCELLGDIE